MTIRKTALTGLAIAALTALITPAFADAALTSHDVTLLAGPGTSFSSVEKLPANARVGVLWCGSAKFDWCLVDFHKTGGWVHTADLQLLGPNGEILNPNGHGVAAGLPGGLNAAPATPNEGVCLNTCGPITAGDVGPGGVKAIGGGL